MFRVEVIALPISTQVSNFLSWVSIKLTPLSIYHRIVEMVLKTEKNWVQARGFITIKNLLWQNLGKVSRPAKETTKATKKIERIGLTHCAKRIALRCHLLRFIWLRRH